VRKLLCAKALVAVTLAASVVACGSSPTAPTTAANAQPDVTSPAPTPTPVPTPADPAPVPAPLPPVPAPPAPPMPSPAAVWTFDGATSHAQWWAAPILPEGFQLEIANGSMEAAGHSFPILSQAPGNVYVVAGTRNVETLTVEYHGAADGSGSWTWTYNGQPGQANGTLTRR